MFQGCARDCKIAVKYVILLEALHWQVKFGCLYNTHTFTFLIVSRSVCLLTIKTAIFTMLLLNVQLHALGSSFWQMPSFKSTQPCCCCNSSQIKEKRKNKRFNVGYTYLATTNLPIYLSLYKIFFFAGSSLYT